MKRARLFEDHFRCGNIVDVIAGARQGLRLIGWAVGRDHVRCRAQAAVFYVELLFSKALKEARLLLGHVLRRRRDHDFLLRRILLIDVDVGCHHVLVDHLPDLLPRRGWLRDVVLEIRDDLALVIPRGHDYLLLNLLRKRGAQYQKKFFFFKNKHRKSCQRD